MGGIECVGLPWRCPELPLSPSCLLAPSRAGLVEREVKGRIRSLMEIGEHGAKLVHLSG